MKRYCFTVGGVICILGIIGIVMYTHPVHHTSVAAPVKEVLPTRTLTLEPFMYEEHFIGHVQAIQSVDIVPYLSGYLREISVQPGTEVVQGQVLFVLDQRIPLTDLDQAKEAVAQAEATRTNAETYYERMKKTESKAISSTELEQARTAFQAADAAYQKAVAAQNQAQTMYDYTTITAPVGGWVGNITATVGEYLSPEGKTLATVTSYSPVRIVFSVPLSAAHQSKDFIGATMRLVLSDGKHIDLNDFQIRQDNHADRATGSLLFFADVPNLEKALVPEAFIEVHFLFPKEGILVEKNHVILTPTGAETYVLEGNIIQKRNVKIGASIANQYWVTSGLSVGDKMITVPVSATQIGHSVSGDKQ